MLICLDVVAVPGRVHFTNSVAVKQCLSTVGARYLQLAPGAIDDSAHDARCAGAIRLRDDDNILARCSS